MSEDSTLQRGFDKGQWRVTGIKTFTVNIDNANYDFIFEDDA